MTREIEDLIKQYYDEDKHEEIVKLVMSVPEIERDVDMLGQLVVAYNNLERYDDAIALSMELKDASVDNISWYYRISYALIGKEQYREAEPYLKYAMELAKKREDGKWWMQTLKELYRECRGNRIIRAVHLS